MNADHYATIHRLIERRSDIVLAEVYAGRPALVRPDELLVSRRDAAEVADRADKWVDRVEADDDAQISRLRLRPGRVSQPAELAHDLAGGGKHRRRAVTLNHLMRGAPDWWGGPADLARPLQSLDEPPARDPAKPTTTVVTLDTGIDAHPWFTDEPWWSEVREQDREVLDAAPEDDVLDLQAGHGTFVAGIIRRTAPNTHVVPNRVLQSDGFCDDFDVVRKLRRLKRYSVRNDRHIDVINMSFGGYTVDDQPSPMIADAVAALGRDTVVVACAGNDSTDRPFWPAALKPVIAVGALDREGGDRAAFSNYGWWVDACAVGRRVTSSFVTFDGPSSPSSNGGADRDNFTGYASWSGTSFAAPRVAGAIAACASESGISASAARDIVLDPDAADAMPDLGVVVK